MRSVADSPTLIVDTASLYFRAYYGVSASLTDEAGHPVNAVHGLLDMLARLVQIYSPAALVCAWDDDWRPAWRVELVPSYKTHRLATPEVLAGEAASGHRRYRGEPRDRRGRPLARQVPWIVDCLTAAGLASLGAPGFEPTT